MTVDEFRKIIVDAKAFREAARLVEQNLRDIGARDDTTAPLHGKGWPSHDVWAALKTVSHFNLQNAMELGFKAFLGSIGVAFSDTHLLKGLYGRIPVKEVDAVDALFRKVSAAHPEMQFKAFARAPNPPAGPKMLRLHGLQGFLKYFDRDVNLWKKRYTWEEVSKEKWIHYLDDIALFLVFGDELETLSLKNWKKRHASPT